jgi:hypothetical protein
MKLLTRHQRVYDNETNKILKPSQKRMLPTNKDSSTHKIIPTGVTNFIHKQKVT